MARHPQRQDPPVNRREIIASRHKLLVRKLGVVSYSQCSRQYSRRILELPNHSLGSSIIISIDGVRVHEKDGTAARGVVVEAEAGV